MSNADLDFTDYYGVDVTSRVRQFVNALGVSAHPNRPGYSGVIYEYSYIWGLDPNEIFEEDDSAMLMFTAGTGDHADWFVNIGGKVDWIRDNELDSKMAGKPGHAHRLRPGHFPYDGAVYNYRGFGGGISGLAQESDRALFEDIIDHMADEVMAPVANELMLVVDWARAANLDVGSWKFYDGDAEHFAELATGMEKDVPGFTWQHSFPELRAA